MCARDVRSSIYSLASFVSLAFVKRGVGVSFPSFPISNGQFSNPIGNLYQMGSIKGKAVVGNLFSVLRFPLGHILRRPIRNVPAASKVNSYVMRDYNVAKINKTVRKQLMLLLAVGYCWGTVQCFGQHYTQQITNVKTQATIWANALMKHDHKTVLSYTNIDGFPKGKLNLMTEAKALKIIVTADSQLIKQGIAIKSIQFGEVLSILKVGFEFQCTVEQTTETAMQVGKVITKSTLIGTSPDNGITWKFIDATGRDKLEIRRLVPRLSDKLLFATKESPKFILEPKAKAPAKQPAKTATKTATSLPPKPNIKDKKIAGH